MVDIIPEYNFNVATRKTEFLSEMTYGQQGGKCPRDCANCVANGEQCYGCDYMCTDRNCRGDNCFRCPFLCARGGNRLEKAIRFIGGLEIDDNRTQDMPIETDCKFIPAYNSKLPENFKYPIISVPFYSIFNFIEQKQYCSDIKDFLRIPDETDVIINFYFKDDKIIRLFDYMMDGSFISLIRSYSGVSYWHTPCFSVFDVSSSMDCLLNFKRQFWIGDIMRDAGFNVFQEVLYSLRKKKIKADLYTALEVIAKKKIKKISQCGQLNFHPQETLKKEMPFIRGLPADVQWLITGLNGRWMGIYNSLRSNMFFSNYSACYRHKKDFDKYISTVNSELGRRW